MADPEIAALAAHFSSDTAASVQRYAARAIVERCIARGARHAGHGPASAHVPSVVSATAVTAVTAATAVTAVTAHALRRCVVGAPLPAVDEATTRITALVVAGAIDAHTAASELLAALAAADAPRARLITRGLVALVAHPTAGATLATPVHRDSSHGAAHPLTRAIRAHPAAGPAFLDALLVALAKLTRADAATFFRRITPVLVTCVLELPAPAPRALFPTAVRVRKSTPHDHVVCIGICVHTSIEQCFCDYFCD